MILNDFLTDYNVVYYVVLNWLAVSCLHERVDKL